MRITVLYAASHKHGVKTRGPRTYIDSLAASAESRNDPIMRHRTALLPLVLLLGCGDDDPVSVSDVVDLKLTLSSGDVSNNALYDEKNVNTESGNPYGAFIARARDELGRAPSRIAVTGTTVTVDATSKNVTTLGAVFTGTTTFELIMNGSTTRHVVATNDVVAADGAGPITFTVDFDSDAIPDADYAELASGSFKVALSGAPAPSFAAANADADITISLTFEAFE